uniref:hypothetical protein n=1 Tax=Alloprevotella sp. TaxID=1872471 RepID=UPI004027478E
MLLLELNAKEERHNGNNAVIRNEFCPGQPQRFTISGKKIVFGLKPTTDGCSATAQGAETGNGRI